MFGAEGTAGRCGPLGLNLQGCNIVVFLVLPLLAVSHNGGSINHRLLLLRTKQLSQCAFPSMRNMSQDKSLLL